MGTELFIFKGARIAGVMGDLLRNVLNSHVGPLRMSKAKAYKIFSVVENIKVIRQIILIIPPCTEKSSDCRPSRRRSLTVAECCWSVVRWPVNSGGAILYTS